MRQKSDKIHKSMKAKIKSKSNGGTPNATLSPSLSIEQNNKSASFSTMDSNGNIVQNVNLKNYPRVYKIRKPKKVEVDFEKYSNDARFLKLVDVLTPCYEKDFNGNEKQGSDLATTKSNN